MFLTTKFLDKVHTNENAETQKPYWNNELQNLLQEVKIADLSYQGDRRAITTRREIFKIKSRQFDKRLR